MAFQENLRKARLARGLTQEALGDALGMAPQTVSKWERGESLPDAALLPAMAETLGVSLDRLFDRRTASREDAAAAVQSCLQPLDMAERWDAAMFLEGVIALNVGGTLERPDLPEAFRDALAEYLLHDREAVHGFMTSQGFAVYSRRGGAGLSLFTLVPKPKAGWAWAIEQDKPELWETLADADVRRALRFIYDAVGYVARMDRGYVDKLLGSLELTEPEKVLEALVRLGVLLREKTRLDGKEAEIFTFRPHVDLIQLLLLGNAGPWRSMDFSADAGEDTAFS